MNKLPIAIIISSIILGGAFLAIQLTRQSSIERQQSFKNNLERREQDFRKEIECYKLLKDLRKMWTNVAGVGYDLLLNTCVVKYFDSNNIMQEIPIGGMTRGL